ncbi:nucleotide-binding alpha-beta plait domain-containing protein [Tanacetum coccineum]
MGDRRLKEDDVRRISTSIFVTNFHEEFKARDLWRICTQYGTVIDAFIPNRRSKSGYRFGFVRFIKIKDVDRLKSNVMGGTQKEMGVHGHSISFAQTVKRGNLPTTVAVYQKPALVLDVSCTSHMEFSLFVVGKLKEFALLPNLESTLAEEGFDDIIIRYMGGFWVLVQLVSKIQKDKFLAHVGVGSWFSELQPAYGNFKINERVIWIDVEDEEAPFFHRKRLCINTTLDDMIFESFKIIVKGKFFWICAKEVTGWTPDLDKCDEAFTNSDNESLGVNSEEIKSKANSKVDSDVEEIPETIFEQGDQDGFKSKVTLEKSNDVQEEIQSADPFNIYELLKKKKPSPNVSQQPESEPKYPPGFTPKDVSEVSSNTEHEEVNAPKVNHEEENVLKTKKKDHKPTSKEEIEDSVGSGHFKSAGIPKTSGSILQLMEDLINVGQTMGYKMDGCINNFEEIVKNQGAHEFYR